MINVSIFGGSGYAGGELLRILLQPPHVQIKQVTSRQFAGQPVSVVHPNLRKVTDLIFIHPDELTECDLLVIGLPNGVSMGQMQKYMKLAPKIIDLGADFRIHDQNVFQNWYRKEHQLPEALPQFTYGLAELHREEIKKSSYVACGGCEATVSILSL